MLGCSPSAKPPLQDVGDARPDVIPEDCWQYNNDEESCIAAGCNLYEGGSQYCVGENGGCIEESPYSTCGSVADDDYGFNGVRIGYFVTPERGRPIVVEFDWLQAEGELRQWETCRVPPWSGQEGATVRTDAPKACACTDAPVETTPGDCPDPP